MKSPKKHIIFDHVILSYFLLAIIVLLFQNIGTLPDAILTGLLKGGSASDVSPGGMGEIGSGVFAAAFSMIPLALYKFWFRPDFKGCLTKDNVKAGLIMLLPVVIVHYAGSIVSMITVGVGNVFFALLATLSPGFVEEIAFRGLGVANYMRTINDKKKIKVIFWISSISFGMIHLLNILGGGDPISVIVQSIYATGIGMAFGAVYLRTGSLWPTIIAHATVDFLELARADLSSSGGLMTGLGIGDWITNVSGIIAAIVGLRLIREEYYDDIMRVWNDKWNRTAERTED